MGATVALFGLADARDATTGLAFGKVAVNGSAVLIGNGLYLTAMHLFMGPLKATNGTSASSYYFLSLDTAQYVINPIVTPQYVSSTGGIVKTTITGDIVGGINNIYSYQPNSSVNIYNVHGDLASFNAYGDVNDATGLIVFADPNMIEKNDYFKNVSMSGYAATPPTTAGGQFTFTPQVYQGKVSSVLDTFNTFSVNSNGNSPVNGNSGGPIYANISGSDYVIGTIEISSGTPNSLVVGSYLSVNGYNRLFPQANGQSIPPGTTPPNARDFVVGSSQGGSLLCGSSSRVASFICDGDNNIILSGGNTDTNNQGDIINPGAGEGNVVFSADANKSGSESLDHGATFVATPGTTTIVNATAKDKLVILEDRLFNSTVPTKQSVSATSSTIQLTGGVEFDSSNSLRAIFSPLLAGYTGTDHSYYVTYSMAVGSADLDILIQANDETLPEPASTMANHDASAYPDLWTSTIVIKNYHDGDLGIHFTDASGSQIQSAEATYMNQATQSKYVDDDPSVSWNGLINHPKYSMFVPFDASTAITDGTKLKADLALVKAVGSGSDSYNCASADLTPLSGSQISSMASEGIRSIGSSDSSVSLNSDQSLAIASNNMTISAANNGKISVQDGAVSIDSLTSDQIKSIGTSGFNSISVTDQGAQFNYAQMAALENANINVSDTAGHTNQLADFAANIGNLTATQIGDLAHLNIKNIVIYGDSNLLGADHIAALDQAGITTTLTSAPPVAHAGQLIMGVGGKKDITSFLDGLITPGSTGDTETITSVSDKSGSVALHNGDATYTAPYSGTDTITYQAKDQNGNIAINTVAVTVDMGPTAVVGTISATGTSYYDETAYLLSLVTPGIAGDTETITDVSVTAGDATLTSSGTVRYTAPASGTDSIFYTVTDQYGNTVQNIATVSLHDGPVLYPDFFTMGHDATKDLTSLIKALAAPGASADSETITSVSDQSGVINLTNGVVSYTAPHNGTDVISYSAKNASGNVGKGTVSVTIDPGPITKDASLIVGHNQSLHETTLIDGLISFGPIGGMATVTSVSGANVSLSGSDVTYKSGAFGQDSFTYTATDKYGVNSTGTVSVTIDKGPTTKDATLIIGHNQTKDVTAFVNNLISAGLAGDGTEISSVSGNNNSFFNGTLSYYSGAAGTDSFTYSARDNYGDYSSTSTVNVIIDAGPTASSGTLQIATGANKDITSLIEGLVQPGLSGDQETITSVTSLNGTVKIVDGRVSYTSATSGSGDTLTYTVTDSYGDIAKNTIAVGLINTPFDPGPTAASGILTIGHGQNRDIKSLLNSLVKLGLPGDVETLTTVSATSGTAHLDTSGSVSYTAPTSGIDTISYTVKDQLHNSAVGTVSVTIDSGPLTKNGTLVIGHNQSLDETALVNSLITEGLTGDGTALSSVSGSNISLANGVVTYKSGASGTDSFTYTATDKYGDASTGTVNVTVDGGPGAYNVTANINVGQSIDLTKAILAAATSGLTGDVLTIVNSSAKGTAGQISLVNGVLVYTASGVALSAIPATGTVNDSFSFVIADQHGDTSTATVTMNVTNPATTVNGSSSGGASVQIADGNVTVNLHGSNNLVSGGNGNNAVSGSTGTTQITLGNGNNSIKTDGANNTITLGSGSNNVSASGSNVTFASGGTTSVIGGGDIITGGSNSTLTWGSNAEYGSGDRVNISSSVINIMANSVGDIYGSTDVINAGNWACFGVYGTNETITGNQDDVYLHGPGVAAGSSVVKANLTNSTLSIIDDAVALTLSGTNDVVYATGKSFNLGDNYSGWVNGSNDTIHAGNGTHLSVSGSANAVTIDKGSVQLMNAGSLAVTGGGNVITANAANATLTWGGNSEYGAGNQVNISSGIVNIMTNSVGDIYGSNDIINAGNWACFGVYGTNETITGNQDDVYLHGPGLAAVSSVVKANLTNSTLSIADDAVALTLSGTNDVVYADTKSFTLHDFSCWISGSHDTLKFDAAFGKDVVNGFNGTDKLQVAMVDFANWSALRSHLSQVGSDTLIALDTSNTITLKNVAVNSLSGAQFLFQ